jgi:hypothetical protein
MHGHGYGNFWHLSQHILIKLHPILDLSDLLWIIGVVTHSPPLPIITSTGVIINIGSF